MPKYIMALDAGTSSNRCILFDAAGAAVAMAQKEFAQHFPQPGFVEHDAKEIWRTQLSTAREALRKAGATAKDVAAIGIANQRETSVVWDKETGEPVHNAIVWQDRRTAPLCRRLKEEGLEAGWRRKTGLPVDPYFSATKIAWMLENVPGARKRAEEGKLLFGTVDTWLVWNLSGGRLHVTDYSNASRTMLFDIAKLAWDEEILETLSIPSSMLPTPVPSSSLLGRTDEALFGAPVPIAGAAGDQQAALFGQCCFNPGEAMNTYGTGCFMLMNAGAAPVQSTHGLAGTVAWGLGDAPVEYALEGSVFTAGSVLQWLRDKLGVIRDASEAEALAASVGDTNGCHLVPAFTGLGAPYWNPYARGSITGLTRGADRRHIVRAALESIAYQVQDVMEAMELDSGIKVRSLKVNGGASVNGFLMQFQSDMLQTPVVRPANVEATATGAAFLAGLATGFWSGKEEILSRWQADKSFVPSMSKEERDAKMKLWHRAVESVLGWSKDEEGTTC